MKPELLHKKKWLAHFFYKAEIAIAGGYHYGNLGDIALGNSIKEILDTKNISSELQTIYNLKYWLERNYVIVGGGAIGYENSLFEIINKYHHNYQKIAFMGVDFNSKSYSDESIELINKAAFISTRSVAQAEKLKELTGRKNIYNQPDLAFSFQRKLFEKTRIQSLAKPKKLFVNVLPLYAMFNNGKLTPLNQYKEERPEIFENFSSIQMNYKNLVLNYVTNAIQNGIPVFSWSFTPMDESFAKYLFGNLNVTHLPYNPNPLNISNIVEPTDEVISTRLHATIFALRSGANVFPIAYAHKNEELLKEMGWNKNEFLSVNDLITRDYFPRTSLKASESILLKLEKESYEMITKGISDLLL
ncbi:MAG: polysaccharide pyruvyl transferase family protein [Bacteroidia bacterium]